MNTELKVSYLLRRIVVNICALKLILSLTLFQNKDKVEIWTWLPGIKATESV